MTIRLHISVEAPGEKAREFDLEFVSGEIVIGRDPDCTIHVPIASASRKHARLMREDGAWLIEDLGSSSGTLVNGHELKAHQKYSISDGDTVEIVQSRITVSLSHDQQIDSNFDDRTSVVAQKMVRDILESPQKDLPHLLVMNGHSEGDRAPFQPHMQELVIGRAKSVDLCIDELNLSRRHARIKREWREFVIEDLGSKNGVVVNGRRITTQTRLKNGDEIFLGPVHLTFFDAAHADEEEFIPQAEEPVDAPRESPTVPRAQSSMLSVVGFPEIVLGVLTCGVFATLIIAFMLWRG